MEIKVVRKHDDVIIPNYATEGSAGFDLVIDSFIKLYRGLQEISLDEHLQNSIKQGYIVLRPFERLLVGTGLFMEIPKGYQLEIRDRSGVSLKKGLKVFNSPGTIDSDYRGEIGVIISNMTQSLNKITIGEKIAQGIITNYFPAQFITVNSLDDTKRSNGGFGSTGI